MKKLRFLAIAIAASVALSQSWSKDEEKWTLPPETSGLKKAAGSDLAIANCVLCHSTDYISMQPPLDRAGWQAIVVKMREKYGAPLPPEKTEAIVEYLAANYGTKTR